ncbi:MAG TPA: GTPase Era [Terriglobia bacterium]|nr:GTPase Era [Terriglobia bacterium]
MPENHQRSGFVTIVGRPNSGKSTLVNSLVGEKISIVTDKPQTTRSVIRGIVTRPEGQIVFLDTPGIHKPIHRMNERMMNMVRNSMGEVDVLALIVDASVPFGKGDEFTLELIKPLALPKVLLFNKIDKVKKRDLLPQIDRYAKILQFDEVIPVSARTGEGVDTFLKTLFRFLPEGPLYYPEDQFSDQQERTMAAEIVREKLIVLTRDELPYSTAVVIDRFEEGEKLYRIYATVLVERESQKAIVIGKGGLLMKEIGTAARHELESLFGVKVFLELRVKVSKDWRDNESQLTNLGFTK